MKKCFYDVREYFSEWREFFDFVEVCDCRKLGIVEKIRIIIAWQMRYSKHFKE